MWLTEGARQGSGGTPLSPCAAVVLLMILSQGQVPTKAEVFILVLLFLINSLVSLKMLKLFKIYMEWVPTVALQIKTV